MTVLDAITSAIATQLNDLAGYRYTRNLLPALAGDVVLVVETTLGWPDAGVFVVSGRAHLYTGKTATDLVGITYFEGATEVSGLFADVAVSSSILDFSRSFSALDQLRAGFLVNTASGDDLSALGRNLSIDRPATLTDDDTFREVIKALAYTPRGTVYALELAMTAFFGAGNFEIWENHTTAPNTVFLQVNPAALALTTESVGKTFLGVDVPLLYDDVANTFTIPDASLEGIITGATLEDEDHYTDCVTQIPSADTEVRFTGDVGIPVWEFDDLGSGAAEGVQVVLNAVVIFATKFDFTATPAHQCVYRRYARIQPDSDATLEAELSFSSLTGTATNFSLTIEDGARALSLGFYAAAPGLVAVGAQDGALAPIAGSTTFSAFETITYGIHKRRDGSVEFKANGVTFQTVLDPTLFGAATDTFFSFGVPSAVENPSGYLYSLAFNAHTTTDYWNTRGLVADVSSGAPAGLDTNSAALLVGDVGKPLRTFNSQVTNSEGGTNDGSWLVSAVADADNCTLVGTDLPAAFVETGHPGKVTISNELEEFQTSDRGKTLEVQGASANAGGYLLTHVIDPNSGYPFPMGATGVGGSALVVGAAAGSSGSNGATDSMAGDRFVDATFAAFTLGMVGKPILVRTADNSNNSGVFQITALISATEVEVNSITIGQSFFTETGISWELRETTGFVTESGLSVRLNPNFATETGTLHWELSDTGTTAGLVGTLRQDPPFDYAKMALVLRVRYTQILSAQLLPDNDVENAAVPSTDPVEYDYYPFYMPSNALAAFEAFIDELTVAGVIPEIIL